MDGQKPTDNSPAPGAYNPQNQPPQPIVSPTGPNLPSPVYPSADSTVVSGAPVSPQPVQPTAFQQPAQPTYQPQVAQTVPPQYGENSETLFTRQQAPMTPAAPEAVFPSDTDELPPADDTPENRQAQQEYAQDAAGNQFAGQASGQVDAQAAGAEGPEVSWQSAEFTAHAKTTKWYAAFIGSSAAVVGLAFLITRDVVALVFIAIVCGLFGYMAARNPRQRWYGLGRNGIYIGNKFYPYMEFNGFTVTEESNVIGNIDFMPLKRFAPMLSITYDLKHETEIMELLTKHLPLSHRERSLIDGLMHRIHF